MPGPQLPLGLRPPLGWGLSHLWGWTRPGGTALVTLKKGWSVTGAPPEGPTNAASAASLSRGVWLVTGSP